MRTVGWIFAVVLIATVVLDGAVIRARANVADKTDVGRKANLQEQVENLLKQLDTKSRRSQSQAVNELLRLGPDVLPFLPPPELLSSISVRETVRRIRINLEQRPPIVTTTTSYAELDFGHITRQFRRIDR